MSVIHPKVAWGSVAAAIGVAAIAILQAFHVNVPPEAAAAASTVLSMLAGYFAPAGQPAALQAPQDASQLPDDTGGPQ